MKKVKVFGTEIVFDETAPCIVCGNPVLSISMGGPGVCPSCDCGYWRDGSEWDLQRDHIWILKQFRHLRPHVPTFREVNDVAVALAAHGIRVDAWEQACQVHLGVA